MNKQLKNALKDIISDDPAKRRRAMEPFVRTTFGMFIKCLYRHLGNEVLCEDVLEDVYADIWEKPVYLRDINNEKHLVRRVYLYYMRKRLREVYRRINRNLRLPQEYLKNLIAPDVNALEFLTHIELKETLRKALNKLKARERKAVELWMEGLSYRAIANELKTTVGAAKMLEYRTMLKLRKMLNQCYKDQ